MKSTLCLWVILHSLALLMIFVREGLLPRILSELLETINVGSALLGDDSCHCSKMFTSACVTLCGHRHCVSDEKANRGLSKQRTYNKYTNLATLLGLGLSLRCVLQPH